MRWFDNLKKGFSQLSTSEKLDALFLMHNMCTPSMLSEVSNKLTAVTSRDFVSLLPPKVVNKILWYLDGKSLVYCAGVSRKWRSIVTNSTDLWVRVLKHLLCSYGGDLVEQVTPYQFYVRLGRRAHAIKSMNANLDIVSIPEVNHNTELSSVKNIHSTPSGKLVMSYSVKQPQDFFQKYDVSNGYSSSKILASINTNYVVDFITTDLFLYTSSISGDWHCNVWETGDEVFKISTKENGINNRWFCSFASPCSKCPLLAIFDSNKICTPNDDEESFCPVKMITSFIHEEHGLQFGVKRSKFVCSAQAGCNALVNNAVVSCGDANSSSSLLPCDYHKVILQQQDFQVFIYKVNTQPTPLASYDLDPELLCHLKPIVCPDVPQYMFDSYKFCLSHDQKLIGFACGSEFIYWHLETNTCRHLTISEDFNNLMLLGIGDVFTLLAEVNELISIQPVLILTGTGEILKVFPVLKPSENNTNGPVLKPSENNTNGPVLKPSEDNTNGPVLKPSENSTNGQSRFYNFLTAPLHLSWLSSKGLLNDDVVSVDDVMTVFAAVYDKGTLFSTWSLVL